MKMYIDTTQLKKNAFKNVLRRFKNSKQTSCDYFSLILTARSIYTGGLDLSEKCILKILEEEIGEKTTAKDAFKIKNDAWDEEKDKMQKEIDKNI